MFYGWDTVEKEQSLALLKKLEALFSDSEKWIYWPIATTSDDIEVAPTDPKATKFSLMGACELFTKQDYESPQSEFVDCATREYLNSLSNDDILHGKTNYDDEMLLIKMAIGELSKDDNA